jgi:hypothetical protein
MHVSINMPNSDVVVMQSYINSAGTTGWTVLKDLPA